MLCRCNVYSQILGHQVDLTVALPSLSMGQALDQSYQDVYRDPQPFRVLYLLHGAQMDHSCWLRYTLLEQYLEPLNLAVVMPSGQNSMFVNMKWGPRYFDFITQELPALATTRFHLSRRREDTFIAGLSMGGYGAARAALTYPHQYGGFGVFSGALNIPQLDRGLAQMGLSLFDFEQLFGGSDQVAGSCHDLEFLLEQLPPSAPKPWAYIACGHQDTLNLPMNQQLHRQLQQAGICSQLQCWPGGHDWPFWNEAVRRFLQLI